MTISLVIPAWLLWALGIIAVPVVTVLLALGVWAIWFLSKWKMW